MIQKQTYEPLAFHLIFLTPNDVVTTSQFSGNDDGGEDSGTKLPPDFD